VRAALLACIAALLPAAAAAQSDDLLECTTQAVTPAFRDRIADVMLADDPNGDALFEQLVTVSDDCAARNGLAADKGEAYFTYSLARLPRDAFIVRLGARGISGAVVDEALDFGTGRSNPVITGNLAPEQVERLLAALGRSGVDVEKVGDDSWEMIGAYAAATSLMWQAHAKLR
jgi:hypothetical protein